MEELKKETALSVPGLDGNRTHEQSDSNSIRNECQIQECFEEGLYVMESALRYASNGIPIFPCKIDKKPYTSHGFKDATTDNEQIKRWWQQFPDAIIGMPTGERSGYLVLDVDMPDGAEAIAKLEADNCRLPITMEVKTRSGGRHIYFKNVLGINNSASKLGKNLDIRAEGGYVIVPPSDGYHLYHKSDIAILPLWLENKLKKPKSESISNSFSAISNSSEQEVKNICLEMSQTPEGSRNDKLNRLSFRIGILVGNNLLEESSLELLKQTALQIGLSFEEVESTSKSGFQAGIKSVKDSSDKIPTGFILKADGIYYKDMNDDNDKDAIRISPLIKILARTRDKSNKSWGIWLEWKDLDGKSHNWAMPQSMLAGKDMTIWLARLADEGWVCSSGIQARNLLHRYLISYKTNNRAKSVDTTGWHDDAFVFPDTVFYTGDVGTIGIDAEARFSDSRQKSDYIGRSEREAIVLQVETADNPYFVGGTLDVWQQTIGVWAEGNSRLILSLCSAFTAPLINIIGHENFGFNISGKSSSGKSTALQAASSVWGKGTTDKGGYALSWNSTGNGLEGTASLHNDTLLALDEMGQASAKTVSEAVYMLANGIGKTRARVDGSAKGVKKWRCLILSTGEKGVAEKIRDEGGQVQAGQLVRIVEIDADAEQCLGLFEDIHGFENAQLFADAIKEASATNYGHPSREFIKAIQKNINYVKEYLKEGTSIDRVRKLLLFDNADGEVKRVAKHFLLVATAGELAIKFGIVNWDNEAPFRAIEKCFKSWLNNRGGVGSAEDVLILEKARRMLITFGASRFQDIDNPDVTCNNRLGFKKIIVNIEKGYSTNEYYIPPDIFRTEISSNKSAPKLLYENGLLIKGDGRNYTRKPSKPLPGLGYKRCYVLLMKDEYNNTDADLTDEDKQAMEDIEKHNSILSDIAKMLDN